jgi:ribulose 1,5-bisphosphate synthetase/thiazole synthase
MKHLLIGTMAVAVLAISGPVLAQPATSMAPSGTNATAPTASTGHTGSVTRAHHRRHAVHSARNNSSGSGSSADQLNRQEIEKSQATNPSSMNRMPAGGRPTSGNTNQ